MPFFRDLFNLIYPELCPVCGEPLTKGENGVCIKCLYGLHRTPFTESANDTEKLLWGRFPIERGGSYCKFVKGGISQKLLHEIKYHGNKKLAMILGREMGREIANSGIPFDFIVPVPLHKDKLKKRGYNQSLLLALGMNEVSGIAINDSCLKRIVANPSQTKTSEGAFGRWENTRGIFAADKAESLRLENKHILLVDDVVTTGSTIEACCHALENIAGIKISFYCLAAVE